MNECSQNVMECRHYSKCTVSHLHRVCEILVRWFMKHCLQLAAPLLLGALWWLRT